ncbi:hypothetical protein EMIT0232MI5_210008 [Pseudomonas sp. IT-232MI5]
MLTHAGNDSAIDDRFATLSRVDQISASVFCVANNDGFPNSVCHAGCFFVVVLRHHCRD